MITCWNTHSKTICILKMLSTKTYFHTASAFILNLFEYFFTTFSICSNLNVPPYVSLRTLFPQKASCSISYHFKKDWKFSLRPCDTNLASLKRASLIYFMCSKLEKFCQSNWIELRSVMWISNNFTLQG